MLQPKTFIEKYNVLHKVWLLAVVLLVLSIFFFRLYRLPEYLMFLSDQGRDAIVLKRLVTLEKLVFVGPTTSIGNVFTGPFYYYLVAPFMFLSGLHPVGPAFGVALMNSLGLVSIFWYVLKKFGRVTGLMFLALAGLSATQIWQSRYSWNPNPVPLFTFLTLVAWEAAMINRKARYFALAGILFGFSLQLHYIAIIILVPLVLSLVQTVITSKQGKAHDGSMIHLMQDVAKGATVFFLSSVATFAPLIVFEIKNRFVNTQTFIRAFSAGEIQAKNSVFIDRLRDTCAGLLQHVFLIEVNRDLALWIVVLFLAAIWYFAFRDRRSGAKIVQWSSIVVLVNILALSRLETGRHVHYYNPSYWLVYLLIAYLVLSIRSALKALVRQCKQYFISGEVCSDECVGMQEGVHPSGKVIECCTACRNRMARKYHPEKTVFVIYVLFISACLSWYAVTQLKSLYFLTDKPKEHTQITHAQHVAKYIIDQTKTQQFQVVGLPFYEIEGHYRYFLEYYGHRPMPADALGDPQELFVICHELNKPDCDIPGNPQWQIADFQNRHQDWRVESEKLVEEVRVFKLVY